MSHSLVSPGLLGCPVPLVERYDLALLDLDGVVYVGPDAVRGAAEAISAARASGQRIAFVTNNAARPAPIVAAHLRELGVAASDTDVVTSAQAAARLLADRVPTGSRILVVGGEGLHWALRAAGLEPVLSLDDGPVAVVQGFSPNLGWRDLAEGTRAVHAGLPWIATNTDLTVPTPHGPAPGNGTLVAAIATATGARPEVAGKPNPPLLHEAVRHLDGRRPLMVGDRLDTDLEGARAAGMPGMMVLTGVHGPAQLIAAAPHARPHFVAADLGGLLQAHPAPTVFDGGYRCGAAVVTVQDDRLVVTAPGDDGLDLLRAACATAWSYADVAEGRAQADAGAVLELVHGLLARVDRDSVPGE